MYYTYLMLFLTLSANNCTIICMHPHSLLNVISKLLDEFKF
jgi:hypothetical protein